MNDNRFIDLVNLYIDRSITAAETAELETEIQSNPRRRAIYRQYCQMHRATTLVYESFRAHAPEQRGAAATGDVTIARFQTSRNRGTHWSYYAAGAAAAACLALVFVQLNARKAAAANLLAKTEALPAVRVVAAPPARVMVPVVEPKAGPVSLRNNAGLEPGYSALLTALRPEEQRAFNNGQSDRLPSLFDDGVFQSQQVMPVINQRVYHSRQTPAQSAEFTAFQFQR